MSITRFMTIITVCAVSLTACQLREVGTDVPGNTQTQADPNPSLPSQPSGEGAALVGGADGTKYSVDCLRTRAAVIQQKGRAAMSDCVVSPTELAGSDAKTKFSRSHYDGYYYYYYPPYYYYPQSYGTTYGFDYYHYYNSYFCSYIFGQSWGSDCGSSLFGYQPTYTNNNYNSNCYYCLAYSNSSSSTACLAGCYLH